MLGLLADRPSRLPATCVVVGSCPTASSDFSWCRLTHALTVDHVLCTLRDSLEQHVPHLRNDDIIPNIGHCHTERRLQERLLWVPPAYDPLDLLLRVWHLLSHSYGPCLSGLVVLSVLCQLETFLAGQRRNVAALRQALLDLTLCVLRHHALDELREALWVGQEFAQQFAVRLRVKELGTDLVVLDEATSVLGLLTDGLLVDLLYDVVVLAYGDVVV